MIPLAALRAAMAIDHAPIIMCARTDRMVMRAGWITSSTIHAVNAAP